MIETSHDHCATCDWLGREAERTAQELRREHWTSTTTDEDGTVHTAHWSQSGDPS